MEVCVQVIIASFSVSLLQQVHERLRRQHGVAEDVAQSAPGEHVDEVKTGWVTGGVHAQSWLGAGIPRREVRHAVLHGEPSLGDGGALHGHEDKTTEAEHQGVAAGDDEVEVRESAGGLHVQRKNVTIITCIEMDG